MLVQAAFRVTRLGLLIPDFGALSHSRGGAIPGSCRWHVRGGMRCLRMLAGSVLSVQTLCMTWLTLESATTLGAVKGAPSCPAAPSSRDIRGYLLVN